jgi:hypothetical protein
MQLRQFYGSVAFTAICLILAALYGFLSAGTWAAALSALWICVVLGVLETSLSFDNAVVNASVLKDMSAKWQQRFLTWGVLIAVFGMRIVFPVAIVAVAGKLNPVDALTLSLSEPARYATIVSSAHTSIMGFGGSFLMLVGLKFFFDSDKAHHWIEVLERPLQRFADLTAVEIIVTLLILYGVSTQLGGADAYAFLTSGIFGIATFFAVEWTGNALGASDSTVAGVQRAGLGAFLYLEVLDASFSFDGVIGAFALSNNLIIIALGLGIGAMFVRSMTIALVKGGALSQFRYLEHGAFWAILALAVIMMASVVVHVPETVTGLIGAVLIGAALLSSIRHNRKSPPVMDVDGSVSTTLKSTQVS